MVLIYIDKENIEHRDNKLKYRQEKHQTNTTPCLIEISLEFTSGRGK